MCVKLQLVICNDDGHEETVTDVITLSKNNKRIEHLGLTLAESKQLLSTLHATGFVELTVNEVVSKRFCKKTADGAPRSGRKE